MDPRNVRDGQGLESDGRPVNTKVQRDLDERQAARYVGQGDSHVVGYDTHVRKS